MSSLQGLVEENEDRAGRFLTFTFLCSRLPKITTWLLRNPRIPSLHPKITLQHYTHKLDSTGRNIHPLPLPSPRLPLQTTHPLLQDKNLPPKRHQRRQRLHVPGHAPRRRMETVREDRAGPPLRAGLAQRAEPGRCGRGGDRTGDEG